MIELYAITDAPGTGLADLAPLRVLPSGRLAVVYARAAGGEVSADALWRHEELVEALMQQRDVLPFRYGTRCEDEASLARIVQERHGELTRALDGIRGAVELSLRVLATQSPDGPPSAGESGADYVAAKSRAGAVARAVVDSVHGPLSALARASRQRAIDTSEPLRAAYLVDRGQVDGFARSVADLQARHPELRLLCTGPWPAYSFAES